jgi:hypothetical protein
MERTVNHNSSLNNIILSIVLVLHVSAYFFMWRFDPIPDDGLPLQGFAVTLIGHTTLGRTFLYE